MRGGPHTSRLLAPALFVVLGALTAATLLITQELRRGTDIVNSVRISPKVPDRDTRRVAIAFNLTRADALTDIEVVNRDGVVVRVLAENEPFAEKRHRLVWDLRRASGTRVRPALYRIRVHLGEQDRTITLPPGIRVPDRRAEEASG